MLLKWYIYIYIYIYILGVARYTDVTVRYVPQFWGSRFDTISVQQEKNKIIYYAWFLFIYFEQSSTVVIVNIIIHYIYNMQSIYIWSDQIAKQNQLGNRVLLHQWKVVSRCNSIKQYIMCSCVAQWKSIASAAQKVVGSIPRERTY